MSAQSSYNRDSDAEPPSFEALVEAHYGSLYQFAMSLTRSESEARDLVQDTFVTWARKGHQLADGSKAKGWLFTTLHRSFLQQQRHIVRFPHVEIENAEEQLEPMASEAVVSADARSVLELLDRVEPQFKAALALFYLEDFSYEEIAQMLGVPLGTVKSRIARGIKQLKSLADAKTTAQRGSGA